MSLEIDRLRYWLRRGLGGLDSTDLDDTDADELLNFALWDLEDKFPFKAKEKCYEAELVVGQTQYALMDNLDAIHSVAIIDENGKSHKLARMTRDWLDENSDAEFEGTPGHYLREDNHITVFPVPNEVLELKITIKESVASLLEGTVDSTGLPRNWDEIVIQGAVWRGHYFKEDYNLAQQAANFQIGLIRSAVPTEAKEERDSRYAGLQVLTDWPDEMVD